MKTKLALLSLLASAVCLPAFGESTAFTYQGRLNEGATPAGGLYDLRFSIYDSSVAGGIVAGPVTNSATGVTNGLFAVTLDFGGAAFNGADRWLQIDVRTNGPSAFIPFSSRQRITPTPYAIHAAQAAGLTNGAISNPTFIGTTTGAPLTLFANNQTALRLQSSSGGTPNLIGGSSVNSIDPSVVGSTIAGGGEAGSQNSIAAGAIYSVIGGGRGHTIGIGAQDSIIGGGYYNSIQPVTQVGVIAGGAQNLLTAGAGMIGGGTHNSVSGFAGFIGGGEFNTNAAMWAFIGSGNNNSLRPGADFSAISGGRGHFIGTNSPDSTIGGGYFNSIGAGVPVGVVSGGAQNLLTATAGVIGGGSFNAVSGYNSVIAGGQFNTNAATSAFIGAGSNNVIQAGADFAMIGSGEGNIARRPHATVGGGYFNTASGNFNGSGDSGTVAGGWQNSALGNNATVAGGEYNASLGDDSAIGGGGLNTNYGLRGFIGGGFQNTIETNASASSVGGGRNNRILTGASAATIPGGQANVAGGQFSFAAGRQAIATNDGAFVWGDSTSANIVSTNANSVTMRAAGGYRLFTDAGATVGVFLAPLGTSWSTISDRNAKKNFEPVDGRDILEKLAGITIQRWNYKWEADAAVPNLGPMAQDFKAAFYPGRDDKGITTLEFDGVELAAIQGLNQKLNRKDAEIQELKQQNDALTKRLSDLEAAVKSLVAAK